MALNSRVDKKMLRSLISKINVRNLEILMFSTVENKAIGKTKDNLYYIEYKIMQAGVVQVLKLESYDIDEPIDTVMNKFAQFRR